MQQRLIYFNGQFVLEHEAKVSIFDSALMFGDMVFEMTRSFKQKQFKLREHLERLYASIKFVHIPLEMTIDEMEQAVNDTIEANQPAFNDDDEHRIMINVSRGLLGIYHGIEGLAKGPNVIIADFPLRWTVAGMGALFDFGVNAVVPSQRAIPATLLEPKVKNRSRIHYQMANIEASQFKGDNNWALLLDPDGFVAEGTGDNFFIVKDGALLTPEPRNILRGISRAYVIELAARLGIPCREVNLELYDVITADEAFFTATPFCIMPATHINGLDIGTGLPGKLTRRLLEAWSIEVGIDIPLQIKRWNEQSPSLPDAPTPYAFKEARKGR